MTFSWTAHRFSGGALALDVANSVVLRFDAERRIDRFADPAAMDSFAEAANRFCAEQALFGRLAPVCDGNRGRLLALRETTDRFFRAQVRGLSSSPLLADLLDAASAVLRHQSATDTTRIALDAATAHSALRLAVQPDGERLKICPNCHWLFFDRSRNRSRNWCDMAVCGNRAKASRHYMRRRGEQRP
jgi:predicted RNA-binding Zn ribbon-like protein